MIKAFGDPFRIDRNMNGGGFLLEDIPANILFVETLPTIFFVEIDLQRKMISFLFL